MEVGMRHDETRARHEARAEALEDALLYLWRDEDGLEYVTGEILRTLAAAARAASARKRPVRYTEAPETERASGEAWSACEGNQQWTDPMGRRWKLDDRGFSWIVGRYPEPLSSYPFEALDPWPDNPAEACK
jgi:hypothetical protein